MELYTWKNLERIFIFMRFDIRNNNNYQVADIVVKSINKDVSNDEMCKMILAIMPEWKKQLIVTVDEENKKVYSNESKKFTISALEFFKENISMQNYEIAYDIADILQGLPEIVMTEQKERLRQFWSIYVEPFEKKWNCNRFDDLKQMF